MTQPDKSGRGRPAFSRTPLGGLVQRHFRVVTYLIATMVADVFAFALLQRYLSTTVVGIGLVITLFPMVGVLIYLTFLSVFRIANRRY